MKSSTKELSLLNFCIGNTISFQNYFGRLFYHEPKLAATEIGTRPMKNPQIVQLLNLHCRKDQYQCEPPLSY
jgi:hypothetical protein